MINNSSNVRKPPLRSKVWIQLPPGPTLVFKMKLKILVLQQKGKQLTAAQPQKIQSLLATAVEDQSQGMQMARQQGQRNAVCMAHSSDEKRWKK